MTSQTRNLATTLWTPLVLIVLVVLMALGAHHCSGGVQRTVVDAMIKLVVVVGMYIFVGNSGVLSFGHVGFLGIGAYCAAWLTIPPSIKASVLPGLPRWLMEAQWHPAAAAVAGGFLASFVALLFGVPLTRLSGIAASIGTFAMLVILYAIFSNWTPITGGQGSVYGLPIFTNLTAATVLACLSILGAALYQASSSGFRLRGSREDATAAQAAGIDIPRERLRAFVLSAFFPGVAGALYAYFLTVVVARQFYLDLTFITIAMLVIGGMRSLSGAVLGTAFVVVLSELLRRMEHGIDLGFLTIGGRLGLQEVGLAVLMLLSLIFRPRGLTGGKEILVPRFLK
jgi:branched-chain amino acid transport system permease protein